VHHIFRAGNDWPYRCAAIFRQLPMNTHEYYDIIIVVCFLVFVLLHK